MSDHAPSSSFKNLYLILIATFVFGFATGVILYLQNNTGKEGDGAIETNTKGFTIEAYTYGGCEEMQRCASYRIQNDGSYTYFGRLGEEETKQEGTVTSAQRTDLRETLGDTELQALTNTTFGGECPAFVDGLAYRYEIEYEGNRYAFDSCVEELRGTPLFDTLENYFEIFTNTRSVE